MSQTAEAVDEGEEEEQLEQDTNVELAEADQRKRQPPTVAVAMQLVRAASLRRKRRKSTDLGCSNPKYHGTDAAASSEAPAASSEAPAASSEAPEAPAASSEAPEAPTASSEAPAEAQLVSAEAELVSAEFVSPCGKSFQLVAGFPSPAEPKPDTTEPDTNEPSTPAKPSPAKVKGAEEIDREADYRSVKTNSLKRSLSSMELPGEVFGNLELFDFVIYIYIYIYIYHILLSIHVHI
jgi:hypothetical protein